MAATLGFPFTAAQWKELERQAMIYKYMVASVPVPYQLLLPIIQNLPPPPPPAAQSPHPLVRYSSKQDLEPGRCKRTDGKKWRCSRDVAPNHKYCDRHMHRGRPRSRKHVELSKNPTHSNPCKLVGSGSTILPSPTQQPPSSFLLLLHNNNKRGWDWSRDGGSEQQWRQTSRSIFNNQFGESFTDFGTDSCGLDLSMAMGLGNTNGMEQGESSQVSCGGPLAEVLRPPTCPGDGDGDSPLQRTMLSVSDASTVCNSPTPTEIVWFT